MLKAMGLQGELATFGLADLLQWLEGARATGTLSLVQEGLDRRLLVRDGALVGVAAAGLWESLLRSLAAAGAIDDERIARMRLGRLKERTFEEALAEVGVDPQLPLDLAAEELKCALAATLAVRAGRFVFAEEPLPVPDDEPLALRMSLRELLFDAFRIADEQPQVDRVVGGDATAFAPVDAGPGRLSPTARAVLAQVGKGNTVGAVRLALCMSRALCARQIYELVLAGRLQRASGDAATEVDPLARLLSQGSALLHAGELQAAALLCASLRSADPTDRRVREFARAVETEQASQLYARLLPPCVYARVPARDAQTLKLRPVERQVLQLVNGVWDTATVVLASPLREVETLQALEKLVEMGLVVATHERDAAR